jgi:hypothetical protein
LLSTLLTAATGVVGIAALNFRRQPPLRLQVQGIQAAHQLYESACYLRLLAQAAQHLI